MKIGGKGGIFTPPPPSLFNFSVDLNAPAVWQIHSKYNISVFQLMS